MDAGKAVISQYLAGDRAGAAGSLIGNLGMAGATGALGDEFTSKPTTNYSPEYGAARRVARAVLPKEGDFNAYVDALQREQGNVEQYAAQNGLSTGTPLNMSIAARESANDLGSFYRTKLLGPNADKQVPVPSNYDSVGASPSGNPPASSGSRYATLGDIDQRINDLNDIIRPARSNATQGATATDLANLQAIVKEHDALVNILHNQLGSATGLDPNVIAGIRQSLGARNQLADQTLAGANRTTLTAGKMARGASPIKGTTVTQAALDLVNRMRGGSGGNLQTGCMGRLTQPSMSIRTSEIQQLLKN